MMQSSFQFPESISSPAKNHKKKYSKVNDFLKKEFLSLIIQQNMSIKHVILSLFRPLTSLISTIVVPKLSLLLIENSYIHSKESTKRLPKQFIEL